MAKAVLSEQLTEFEMAMLSFLQDAQNEFNSEKDIESFIKKHAPKLLRAARNTLMMDVTLYKQAFNYYGMDQNCGFLSEECGELLSAVNKYRRGRNTKNDVIEELADVYQLIIAFAQHLGYTTFVDTWLEKHERLKKRIVQPARQTDTDAATANTELA